MGVHVDGAGHNDLAGDVINFIRLAPLRRCNDAAVFDEDVALRVALIHRVNDTAAFELNEHQAFLASINSAIRVSTSATVGLSLFAFPAFTMPMPEIGER